MSQKKKEIRAQFRQACLERDGFKCAVCSASPAFLDDRYEEGILDVHHITPRDDMPHGGYVLENGITLCRSCHEDAENWFHNDLTNDEPFSPKSLYKLIDSSREKAVAADAKNNWRAR